MGERERERERERARELVCERRGERDWIYVSIIAQPLFFVHVVFFYSSVFTSFRNCHLFLRIFLRHCEPATNDVTPIFFWIIFVFACKRRSRDELFVHVHTSLKRSFMLSLRNVYTGLAGSRSNSHFEYHSVFLLDASRSC